MSNQIPEPAPTVEEVNNAKTIAEADVKPVSGTATAWKYNADYHKMTDYIGLSQEDKMDENIAKKVSFIRDYTNAKDELDAMVQVRNFRKELGLNTQGKELLDTLYKFLRLKSQRDTLDKEMSLYYGSQTSGK
jgi:hypothetical protein